MEGNASALTTHLSDFFSFVGKNERSLKNENVPEYMLQENTEEKKPVFNIRHDGSNVGDMFEKLMCAEKKKVRVKVRVDMKPDLM